MQVAISDENPYPRGSLSHNIWERNHEPASKSLHNATDRDKYIIYLFIMDRNISRISKSIELSEAVIRKVLQRYHII